MSDFERSFRIRAALITIALLLGVAIVGLAGGQDPNLGARLAEEEQLTGTVDGVNQTFGLAHAPYPWISLKLFRNGVRMTRCRNGVTTNCDYTLIAPWNKLTFVAAQTPRPGDILVADYRW